MSARIEPSSDFRNSISSPMLPVESSAIIRSKLRTGRAGEPITSCCSWPPDPGPIATERRTPRRLDRHPVAEPVEGRKQHDLAVGERCHRKAIAVGARHGDSSERHGPPRFVLDRDGERPPRVDPRQPGDGLAKFARRPGDVARIKQRIEQIIVIAAVSRPAGGAFSGGTYIRLPSIAGGAGDAVATSALDVDLLAEATAPLSRSRQCFHCARPELARWRAVAEEPAGGGALRPRSPD
jgi:hypothetical protein